MGATDRSPLAMRGPTVALTSSAIRAQYSASDSRGLMGKKCVDQPPRSLYPRNERAMTSTACRTKYAFCSSHGIEENARRCSQDRSLVSMGDAKDGSLIFARQGRR